MPNPMVAQYTKQMSAMVLPEVGGEIGAWAEVRGVPHSQIMRELINAGLEAKRAEWTAGLGKPLSQRLLAEHTRRCTRQGGKQVDRRRDYDSNRRGTERTDDPTSTAAIVTKAKARRRAADVEAA